MKKNSQKSFRLLIIAISIFIVLSVGAQVFDPPATFIGITFFIGCLVGLAGWFYSLKSLPEPNTGQKIVALILNSLIVLSLVAFILGDLLGN